MMESKKGWMEPELIVLVRSKPEEVIFSTCNGSSGTQGLSWRNDGCVGFTTPNCSICEAIAAS